MPRRGPLYELLPVTCPACGHRTRKSRSWFLAGTRRYTCPACEQDVPLLPDRPEPEESLE